MKTEKKEIILRIQDLTVSYPNQPAPAVSGIRLSLARGEVVGIVGESGCGKTTLLKSIVSPQLHKLRIHSGEVFYQGEDLLHCGEKRRQALLGNAVGVIVQNSISSLNPIRTIRSQVRELLKEKKGLGPREADLLASRFLRAMNCPEDILSRYPFQLSGGQRQRTLTAMTMMLHPSVLLADEPTTALDVSIQAKLLGEIKSLALEYGTGVLLITHNMGVVAGIADRIMVMYGGQILESGTTQSILSSPHHPYTRALLNCIPDLHCEKGRPLYRIPDEREKTPEKGCPFAGRCPECQKRCLEERPGRIPVEGGWYACFR